MTVDSATPTPDEGVSAGAGDALQMPGKSASKLAKPPLKVDMNSVDKILTSGFPRPVDHVNRASARDPRLRVRSGGEQRAAAPVA
jgi:hypothetical protein